MFSASLGHLHQQVHFGMVGKGLIAAVGSHLTQDECADYTSMAYASSLEIVEISFNNHTLFLNNVVQLATARPIPL